MAGNPMGGGGGGGEAAPPGEPTRLKLQYSLRKEVTTGFKGISAAKFTELLGSLKSAANNDARIELLETGRTAGAAAQRSTKQPVTVPAGTLVPTDTAVPTHIATFESPCVTRGPTHLYTGRASWMFTCKQLLEILNITPSVKTRMAFVDQIAPRYMVYAERYHSTIRQQRATSHLPYTSHVPNCLRAPPASNAAPITPAGHTTRQVRGSEGRAKNRGHLQICGGEAAGRGAIECTGKTDCTRVYHEKANGNDRWPRWPRGPWRARAWRRRWAWRAGRCFQTVDPGDCLGREGCACSSGAGSNSRTGTSARGAETRS